VKLAKGDHPRQFAKGGPAMAVGAVHPEPLDQTAARSAPDLLATSRQVISSLPVAHGLRALGLPFRCIATIPRSFFAIGEALLGKRP